jgi:hypothetical protein
MGKTKGRQKKDEVDNNEDKEDDKDEGNCGDQQFYVNICGYQWFIHTIGS